MKKLALMLACLAIVLSFAISCGEAGQTGEYTQGLLTQTGYSSDWIGVEFIPTDNLYLATSEEIEQLIGLGADMFYSGGDSLRNATVYEMIAVDLENDDSVMVMTEVLADNTASVITYIEALKTQITLQLGTAPTYIEPTNVTVAGGEYTRFGYTLELDGLRMTQVMYLRKQGNRMISICITAGSDEAEEAFLACFKAK